MLTILDVQRTKTTPLVCSEICLATSVLYKYLRYNRSMNKVLDAVRDMVRAVMRTVARGLNRLTGGKLSPNAVTIVGLLAHLPIAYFIATGRLTLAAVLLVIFGLFDTLDGELARLQKRASNIGMFLDSATD